MNIEALLAGNVRFITGRLKYKDYASDRKNLVEEQHPFAVIVGCSDSRVSPEIVFDATLGELFVIRTAGNVVDSIAMGSIEYAVEHLHVNLVVVLAHESCGAVTAAVNESEEEGDIAYVVEAIKPAVDETKGKAGDSIDNAVRANALNVVSQILDSPIVSEHNTRVIATRYDLNTGIVQLV